MKRSFREMQVVAPRSLAEALRFLHDHADGAWKILAGGTDALVPLYRDGLSPHSCWISMHRFAKELRFVQETDEAFLIGAASTVQDLADHRAVCDEFGIVREACDAFAGFAVRHRATIGGNIANGSPAADLPPVWLSLGALVEIESVRGRRRIPLESFWTGYKRNVLDADEIVTALFVPRKKASIRRIFRKVAPRRANSISIVNLAAASDCDSEGRLKHVRVAFGCMGPYPLRATTIERFLEGRSVDAALLENVAKLLEPELRPISDHRASAGYRFEVAVRLTRAFLTQFS